MEETHKTIAGFKKDCNETFIRLGLHLIGCEFYTGNWEVDGWVVSIYSVCNPVSIRGNKGYSRPLHEISLYLDNGAPVSYGLYMQIYYPEYYHVWKYHLPKEERSKYIGEQA